MLSTLSVPQTKSSIRVDNINKSGEEMTATSRATPICSAFPSCWSSTFCHLPSLSARPLLFSRHLTWSRRSLVSFPLSRSGQLSSSVFSRSESAFSGARAELCAQTTSEFVCVSLSPYTCAVVSATVSTDAPCSSLFHWQCAAEHGVGTALPVAVSRPAVKGGQYALEP